MLYIYGLSLLKIKGSSHIKWEVEKAEINVVLYSKVRKGLIMWECHSLQTYDRNLGT